MKGIGKIGEIIFSYHEGISDFEDWEFYGFAAISDKATRKFKKNYRKQSKEMDIPFRPMWRYGSMGRSESKTGRKGAIIK